MRKNDVILIVIADIEKALGAMDNVIGYYSVVEEVDATVRAGPSAKSLEDYIAVLNRLKNALSYFEKNNPQSVELSNVVSWLVFTNFFKFRRFHSDTPSCLTLH